MCVWGNVGENQAYNCAQCPFRLVVWTQKPPFKQKRNVLVHLTVVQVLCGLQAQLDPGADVFRTWVSLCHFVLLSYTLPLFSGSILVSAPPEADPETRI